MPGALPAYDFNANEAVEKAPVSHNTAVAMTAESGRGKNKGTSAALQEKAACGTSGAPELYCLRVKAALLAPPDSLLCLSLCVCGHAHVCMCCCEWDVSHCSWAVEAE